MLSQYNTGIFKQKEHINDKPNIKREIKAVWPSTEKHMHAVQLSVFI